MAGPLIAGGANPVFTVADARPACAVAGCACTIGVLLRAGVHCLSSLARHAANMAAGPLLASVFKGPRDAFSWAGNLG
jgi:hypothetical protein